MLCSVKTNICTTSSCSSYKSCKHTIYKVAAIKLIGACTHCDTEQYSLRFCFGLHHSCMEVFGFLVINVLFKRYMIYKCSLSAVWLLFTARNVHQQCPLGFRAFLKKNASELNVIHLHKHKAHFRFRWWFSSTNSTFLIHYKKWWLFLSKYHFWLIRSFMTWDFLMKTWANAHAFQWLRDIYISVWTKRPTLPIPFCYHDWKLIALFYICRAKMRCTATLVIYIRRTTLWMYAIQWNHRDTFLNQGV